jgi:hypothetical protein
MHPIVGVVDIFRMVRLKGDRPARTAAAVIERILLSMYAPRNPMRDRFPIFEHIYHIGHFPRGKL